MSGKTLCGGNGMVDPSGAWNELAPLAVDHRPVYRLTAPDVPMPGPDFTRCAVGLGGRRPNSFGTVGVTPSHIGRSRRPSAACRYCPTGTVLSTRLTPPQSPLRASAVRPQLPVSCTGAYRRTGRRLPARSPLVRRPARRDPQCHSGVRLRCALVLDAETGPYLSEVNVHPDSCRRGVVKSLLAWVIRDLPALGHRRMHSDFDPYNAADANLFAGFGFTFGRFEWPCPEGVKPVQGRLSVLV